MTYVTCVICGRETPAAYQEKHHLDPDKRTGPTALVCVDCGDQIHQLFTRKELKTKYNTVAELKAEPRMQTWIAWVKNKKRFGICMKRKKRR